MRRRVPGPAISASESPDGARTASRATAVTELSVFFPAFNEEGNIVTTVHQAAAALDPLGLETLELVVVDDGSTDATGRLADELALADPRVRVVHHPENRGYGAALKTGFATARCDWVFFTDGDGQFDVADIERLLPFAGDYDAVIGYRLDRQDSRLRKLNTYLWTQLVRRTFDLRVRDVDCAFKLLRRSALTSLPPLQSDGALVSTELLVRWRHAGFTWQEVGVNHYPRRAGTATGANLRVIARALRDVVTLRRSL